MAVRYLLQCLEASHPGGTIELRVPPFGAIQLLAGLDHRRGTPPNVVEIQPDLFIELALGTKSFSDYANSSALSLSGARAAEIAAVFPLNSDFYSA